jgi:hypothetical protein
MPPGRLIICLVIGLTLPACPKVDDGSDASTSSSGSPPSGAGSAASGDRQCSPLDGVYSFSYVGRTGNCGSQTPELLEFRNGRSVPTGALSCQAGGEAMTDACSFTRDSTCTVSDPVTGVLLGTTRVTGTLTEVTDNTRIEGSFQVTIVDTSGRSCQGSYDVVGVRQ